MTAEHIAALILEDAEFRAAAIDAAPHTLQLEIRELVVMLVAADQLRLPDGAPFPDIDALTADVATIVTAQLADRS